MSAKGEQLKKLIEAIVRREIQSLVPQLVKESLLGVLLEHNLGGKQINPVASFGVPDNSYKRQMLQQNINEASGVGYEDYPEMNRSRIAEMMGYGDMGGGTGGLITVDSMAGEGDGASPRPIHPSQIPPDVMAAMNRDYSALVKAWDKKR
jgi:hypothetical protein